MTTLDCRGLACPGPVMRARDLVEEKAPKGVEVLVDNQASASNVARFLENRGFTVKIHKGEGEFTIRGTSDAGEEECRVLPMEELEAEKIKTLVLVSKEFLGTGDDVLGRGLMLNFLKTLPEIGEGLWRLVFLNGGVKLTITGTDTLPVIRDLEKSGVSVLVCGTCLNYFELLEDKGVGETTNMLDIVTSLQLADKVIGV